MQCTLKQFLVLDRKKKEIMGADELGLFHFLSFLGFTPLLALNVK